MHKGQGGAQNENAIENEYAHGSCVSHTRSQIRTRSDTARGFTASLIYAALSGLGVVWVVVIFLNRRERRGERRDRRGAQDCVF